MFSSAAYTRPFWCWFCIVCLGTYGITHYFWPSCVIVKSHISKDMPLFVGEEVADVAFAATNEVTPEELAG